MTEGLTIASRLSGADRRTEVRAPLLDPHASAQEAFTDFRRDAPLSVDVQCPISHALAEMARLGVHSLLVTRCGSAQAEPFVVGLVTRASLARRVRRAAQLAPVSVADVMTPWQELPLVHVESLESVSALDMYERFQGTGLTHLLVVEASGEECVLARGVISRLSLARRLRLSPGADLHGRPMT